MQKAVPRKSPAGAPSLQSQRLQNDGTYNYTYDSNGNMLTQKKGNTTTAFTWDYENRLSGVTGTSSYSYDYLGRRKSKTVSSVTTTYLYDGQNLIYELAGSTGADYLFGPGIDEPLAVSRSAQVYYYATDGLGSVGIVSNATGSVQNKYSYDAWGVIKSQTTAIANPFTYTAREAGEAGLMFYRARYYNPSIGRLISEDSLRPDTANFYLYVLNDPLSFKDPTGLERLGPWDLNPPPSSPQKPTKDQWKNKCSKADPLSKNDPKACHYGDLRAKPPWWATGGIGFDWNVNCVCKNMNDSPGAKCVRGCLQCAKDSGIDMSVVGPHDWCKENCRAKGLWTFTDDTNLDDVIWKGCCKTWFQY